MSQTITSPSRGTTSGTLPAKMYVGVWVRIALHRRPCIIGFTYVDPQEGFSAQGWQTNGDQLDESSRVVVRLGKERPACQLLEPEEIQRFRLETPPAWVAQYYGPQPRAGTAWGWWRDLPRLQRHFHPDFPDDVQILLHDGGPELTDRRPETVWVRITGGEGDVFTGRVLTRPVQLTGFTLGSEVRFLSPQDGQRPVLVSEKYLRERAAWHIQPCNKCGLPELFDAPSDLLREKAAEVSAVVLNEFSTLCGVCRGVVNVRRRGSKGAKNKNKPQARPWWRLWGR